MSEDHTIDIAALERDDAAELAPLLAAHVQSLKRGAPGRPDIFYAETLLKDPAVGVLGARMNGALVGFTIFYDLPDPISGLRHGLVENLFVNHDHRGKGIAKALVDVLSDQAEERGWARLVLNAPRQPAEGRRLYEQIAAPADWTSHVIRFDVR